MQLQFPSGDLQPRRNQSGLAVTLRPYQEEALRGLDLCWQSRAEANPIVVVPTGGGKSILIAESARRCLVKRSGARVIVATHVQELVDQNYRAMKRVWPDAPVGIYSAGLGRRDTWAQITFASVQSIFRDHAKLGRTDLLMIDEAHLVSRKASGMYSQLIAGLRETNAACQLVGYTATPWRMDSGYLTEPYGDDPPLFDEIAYEISLLELIADGYLSPPISISTTAKQSVKGVAKRGGEFVESDLDAAVNTDALNRKIVRESIERGEDRRKWLCFGVTIDHCIRLADEFMRQGIPAAMVSGETPKGERRALINAFRAGKLRVLTSVNVLGTGFDVPDVDMIVAARPTCSPGLWLQQAGRGLRIADGKSNCLVLDFAGNTLRFGLLDQIKGISKREKKTLVEEVTVKACDLCGAYSPKESEYCTGCGAAFPKPPQKAPQDRESKLVSKAHDGRVATDLTELQWRPVLGVSYHRHSKPGKPDSLRVTYQVPGEFFGISQWVCLEHHGEIAQKYAHSWWRRAAPGQPIPATVNEALALASRTIPCPRRILVRPEGSFWRIEKAEY